MHFIIVINRLLAIMDNASHPLHAVITKQRSSFSGRLLLPKCSTDRLRKSFVPRAIKLHNTSLGRGVGGGAKEDGLQDR